MSDAEIDKLFDEFLDTIQQRVRKGGITFAILDESGEVLECDLATWLNWLQPAGQRIIQQEMVNGYFVSTVFIGCVTFFETMIFDRNPTSSAFVLWSEHAWTRTEALAMHERAKRAADNDEFEGAPGRL